MALNDLTFFGWTRAAGALAAVQRNGRLHAKLALEAKAVETAQHDSAAVEFDFYGPPDVIGLLSSAVTHVWPAPGATDAEETMCAYAELGAIDLPWRYSPVPREGDAWRPWLVLVVGPTDQMIPQPGGRIRMGAAVLAKHPLLLNAATQEGSARWAHVQRTNPPAPLPSHSVSRLLSPFDMQPNTDYLAAIVPAFTPDGSLSWPAGAPEATVPLYHSWRFRTGDAGDFKDLALRLKARPVDDPLLTKLGRDAMEYPLVDRANVMTVRSALVPPAAVPASGIDPDGPPPFDIAASVAAMRLPERDAEGRHIVQLPTYGEAWVADPLTPSTGWGAALNGNPRHRVAAGHGMWCGVRNQDLIADAARERAAGLFVAAQRIRGLTAGLAAGESLFNRRLPGTPEARLTLFGPALARVASIDSTGAGGTVLASVTDADNARTNGRPMPPALFSSAARRVLRPRTARARHADTNALDSAQIVGAANDCRRLAPLRRPARAADRGESQRGLPHADFLGADLGAGDQAGTLGAADATRLGADLARSGADASLLNQIAPDLWPDLLRAVNARRGPDAAAIEQLLERSRREPDDPGIGRLRELLNGLDREDRGPRCRPVDIGALDAVLVKAFRPSRDGVVARRVLGTITGLDPAEPFAPPEICPDLDLPAWSFLRDEAPSWLMFGREGIQPDDVVAVATNARFINAFLSGLNTQALREMRWRNIPVRAGCTPLRRFWNRITASTPGVATRPTTDIRGIALWNQAQPIGHPDHAPDPLAVRQLVLLFKTDLFRRYPRTLVYLTDVAKAGDGTPAWNDEAPFTNNVSPVFTGEIEPDLVFFGFPVMPEQLADRWVVVEEPPPGYRFRQSQLAAAVAAKDGGRAAQAAFANPTRVLFRGDTFLGGAA